MTFLDNINGIRAAAPAATPGENRNAALQNSLPNLIQNSGQSSAQQPVQKLAGPEYAKAKAEYAAKRDKLQKTTQDFEAVFVGMMLKQMRKSMAGKNALFGNSSESKMYQDMMDDATAKHMSQVGTFGLGQLLFKTMSSTLPPDPDKVPIVNPAATKEPAANKEPLSGLVIKQNAAS